MKIISVNVSPPILQFYGEHELVTGIGKTPVHSARLHWRNFEGDGQADLIHHGSPDQAVCIYAYNHYSYWEGRLGQRLLPGAFGENLTIQGALESQVCIGDIFQIGEAQVQDPPTTAFIERRMTEARRAGRKPRRDQRWVPYSRISSDLKRAVLVTEDAAFWQHEGIDLEQIRESIEVNLERLEFARGASTITQQLAKNLYLSPSRNPVRKLRELMITRRLEAVLKKRRIFEIYLNVIEWGDGIYGAEAAARAYFRAPAASLGPEPSARLAAAIANPPVLNPERPTRRLLRRERMILQRMGHVLPPGDAAPPRSTTPVVRAPG